jgi:tRNA A22 N-methylase
MIIKLSGIPGTYEKVEEEEEEIYEVINIHKLKVTAKSPRRKFVVGSIFSTTVILKHLVPTPQFK